MVSILLRCMARGYSSLVNLIMLTAMHRKVHNPLQGRVFKALSSEEKFMSYACFMQGTLFSRKPGTQGTYDEGTMFLSMHIHKQIHMTCTVCSVFIYLLQ